MILIEMFPRACLSLGIWKAAMANDEYGFLNIGIYFVSISFSKIIEKIQNIKEWMRIKFYQ